MKSIKPGRGPSMQGAIMSIFVALFGVVWTAIAASFAPFMAIFGIIFIAMAVVQAVYNFKNATQKNRYSAFDITEDGEEEDPLNARFGDRDADTETGFDIREASSGENTAGGRRFCPYCGTEAAPDFVFCNNCGKKLP